MNKQTSSLSTLNIVHLLENYWGNRSDVMVYDEIADEDMHAEEHYSVFLQSYPPILNGPVAWLPKIESAIRDSVPHQYYEDENEGQWLDADSAYNALQFLQNSADLLPGEPVIYGTPTGDFVAEFENETAKLTSVVSATQTLLVGVCVRNPMAPVEHVIPRGSNRLRDEVREFTRELAVVHGEKVESGM